VCDQESSDRTVEIASRLGAKVVTFPRIRGNFVGAPKKFAIENATQEFILTIDADERVTPRLARKLRELAADNQHDVVHFRKKNLYFAGYPRYSLPFFIPEPLFFRRSVYLKNYSGAEEQHHNNYAGVRFAEPSLTLPPAYHYIHLAYPTIEKYVTKTLGWYARVEAEQWHESGRAFSQRKMVLEPVRWFFGSFIKKRGYRDGTRGLILHVLFSGYLFLRWANLWLIEQQTGFTPIEDNQRIWQAAGKAAR
jgi:glycosyltransferase involved in cell wall biosynthesis